MTNTTFNLGIDSLQNSTINNSFKDQAIIFNQIVKKGQKIGN